MFRRGGGARALRPAIAGCEPVFLSRITAGSGLAPRSGAVSQCLPLLPMEHVRLEPKTLAVSHRSDCPDNGQVTANRFNRRVPSARASPRTVVGRRRRSVLARAIDDLERIRIDAGISRSRVAAAAKIDGGYLAQVVAGKRLPSIGVLVAVAQALGADLNLRAYPTTGPNIHDRIQARIVEEVLRIAASTWTKAVEVPVFRPARGFIDVVFDSVALATTVATEVESRIDRLEQQLRWSQEKAASLPSSDLWQRMEGERAIHRLLVLRSTASTRQLARRFEAVLQAAYPAPAADVCAALTVGTRWPGDGILWADVTGDTVRIRKRPHRGIDVGR